MESNKERVVILGGAGMLGLALAKTMRGKYDVVIVDDFSRSLEFELRMSEASRYAKTHVFEISPKEHSVDWLAMLLRPGDIVINAAADVGGVGYNRGYGPVVYAKNATLQGVPIYASQVAGVKKFIQVSSVCVYGPTIGYGDRRYENIPEHKESDALDRLSLDNGGYAMAKRDGEILALSSKIENVTVVRPTNMFGPWDHYDAKSHVIPALIRQAVAYDSIDVHSYPNIERDFLYVDQAAQWIVDIIESRPELVDREIINLPSSFGSRMTVQVVAEMAARLAGKDKESIFYHYDDGPAEMWRRVSGDKLFAVLLAGKRPKYIRDAKGQPLAIEEMFQRTVQNFSLEYLGV